MVRARPRPSLAVRAATRSTGLLERVPATRAGARRLGLVTLDQMAAALVHAIEYPPHTARIMEVPEFVRRRAAA